MNHRTSLHKSARVISSIMLGLLMLSTNVSAAEYFVAKSGDDSAAGTSEAAPLATITKGISVLKPGDTLTILPGEYFEAVTTAISGTADAPITIRAQRPGTVTMRGDVEVAGFRPVGPGCGMCLSRSSSGAWRGWRSAVRCARWTRASRWRRWR